MSGDDPAPLPYRYGWVVAWYGLATMTDVGETPYGPEFGLWGAVLGGGQGAWTIAQGLAAAVARPWAWYVLISAPVIVLAHWIVYAAAIAPTRHDVFMAALSVVVISTLPTVYFYRRRALFQARWRWAWAERWWPRLASQGPGRAGLDGASPLVRRLFVTSLLLYGIVRLALARLA